MDDSPVNLRILRQMLERQKADFDTAQTCDEALKLVKKSKYDLLLLDYQLVDKTALDLMVKLRREGVETPRYGFVVLSAHALDDIKALCAEDKVTNITKDLVSSLSRFVS